MKPKHLSLAIAALLAAGGLWFAWSAWRTEQFASHKSSTGVGFKTTSENADTTSEKPDENPGRREPKVSSLGQLKPGQMLRPPDPMRKFWELTPEQRVQQARQPGDIGG